MYRVLRPIYVRTGDVSHSEDGDAKWVRVDHWQELGIARDMADAIAKFPRNSKNGYSPVLEPVTTH